MADAERPLTDDQDLAAAKAPEAAAKDIPDAEIVRANLSLAEPVKPAAGSAVEPSPTRGRRGGALLLLLGGIVAAIIGFGLAQVVPNGWPIGGDPVLVQAIQADLAAQTARNDRLEAELSALGTALKEMPKPDASLPEQIAAVQGAIADERTSGAAELAKVVNANAELAGRIAVLERRPVAGGAASDTALSAYEGEIKALRDMVEAQQKQSESAGADIAAIADAAKVDVLAAEQRAAALQAQAEETARMAGARAAVQRLRAAMDVGGSFGSALDELAAAGVPVPDEMRQLSSGVFTLQMLRAGFDEPSRAALSASLKATVGDSAMARLGAFLRNQVGARSLTAREGSDPDAILSRAGAAVQANDLPAALAEIATLPEPGQAELVPWVAEAKRRLAALAGTETLAAALE